jgi:hypothetical protein
MEAKKQFHHPTSLCHPTQIQDSPLAKPCERKVRQLPPVPTKQHLLCQHTILRPFIPAGSPQEPALLSWGWPFGDTQYDKK